MRKLFPMPDPEGLVTAEELEKFPDNDQRYELVEGRIVRMSPVGGRHGRLALRFGTLLSDHVRRFDLGEVMVEVGFKLATNPDTVRGPDVAFIRRERIPTTGLPTGFWHGPPDLAFEIISPDDRPSEVGEKVDEYLAHGVPLVLVLDPEQKTVAAFRRLSAPITLGLDEQLDASDVVAGFSCRVRDVFE